MWISVHQRNRSVTDRTTEHGKGVTLSPAILTATQVNAKGLLRLPRGLYGGEVHPPQEVLEAGVGAESELPTTTWASWLPG